MWTHPKIDDFGHFVIENLETIDPNDIRPPFEVRRVFYLYGSSANRGNHAHRKGRLLLTCPIGSVRVDLVSQQRRWSVKLDYPTQGLLIEPMVWHTLRDFSPDCVVIVLASEHYDEADYIRDPEDFRRALALTT